MKEFNPKRILVINLGQLGDVLLSLPAHRAIRRRFPDAKLTALVGKACRPVMDLVEVADEIEDVDRYELRDGTRVKAFRQIVGLVRRLRRQKFDLVIDLHSLYETNLLGYVLGGRYRLYRDRENRSLNRLGNFPAKPPREDKSIHLTEAYLKALMPLGIEDASRSIDLACQLEVEAEIDELFQSSGLAGNQAIVGFFIGAGHPSRRWPLARFGNLANLLVASPGIRVAVFDGPEEVGMLRPNIRRQTFPPEAVFVENLPLPSLASVFRRLSVLVANDTGPMHLAAVVGTKVIALCGNIDVATYTPVGDGNRSIRRTSIEEIDPKEVFAAVLETLDGMRTITYEEECQ